VDQWLELLGGTYWGRRNIRGWNVKYRSFDEAAWDGIVPIPVS
jgi:hypothetical protein